MENFYTESKEYLALQNKLKELGHFDLVINLAEVVNDAIIYGMDRIRKT